MPWVGYDKVDKYENFSTCLRSICKNCLTFLDHRVTLWFDENDFPYVYPTRAHDNSRRSGGGDYSKDKTQIGQVIMSINKKRWKQIIEVFEIKEAKVKRDCDEEDLTPHIGSLKKNSSKP